MNENIDAVTRVLAFVEVNRPSDRVRAIPIAESSSGSAASGHDRFGTWGDVVTTSAVAYPTYSCDPI